MFNLDRKAWNQGWDKGSQWGIDTFAWTVEMMLLKGFSLQEAYDYTKSSYVNHENLNKRLDAWKEYNV